MPAGRWVILIRRVQRPRLEQGSQNILRHAAGAVDCVLIGEGETAITGLLDALTENPPNLKSVPGCVTLDDRGPPPAFMKSLDDLLPARDLVQHRQKYFIGALDPAASIEFSRGCPWDCVFCSAWTFYGRNYRVKTPDYAVEELAQIREPGIFIADDVAFIQAEHGMQLGEAIARRGIRKRYYLETRGDVLLRNKEVFQLWKRLGLNTMFLGLEAIDEEGLKRYRKRVTLSKNFEALEFARSLDISVAVNIIGDPAWDRERFKVVRDWCLEIPEVVNISINTPYPGTETWHTESRRLTTRDYRLFDIQHAVLPTKLPLPEFYKELVETQRVLAHKHLGWTALRDCARIVVRQLFRGQTNFIRMLWKFDSVYRPELQLADHRQPVKYKSICRRLLSAPCSEARFTFTKIGGAAAGRSIIIQKSLLTRRAWTSLIDYLLFVNNTELYVQSLRLLGCQAKPRSAMH
jgi:hopanoid C-3 methylase HpnR